MAEQERLTNKERREKARQERKRKEAEAERQRKRNQLRSGLITAAIVVVIGAVLLQAFRGGPTEIEDAILISSEAAEEAREAAGCEVLVEEEPLPDRSHLDAGSAPSGDDLYGEIRPTHSGPHIGPETHPVIPAADRQIDEVATTHNLEHGAILVWWDPAQVDRDQVSAIGDWSETLNANGFRNDRGASGILTSPYEEPGISSGKAVALRAWGTAMDCDTFDETVANAFVIEHFGTHGIAPERTIGQYPDGVLAYEDMEVGDTSVEDAPIDGQTPAPEEADPADDAGDEPADDAADEPADDAADEPADDAADEPADDAADEPADDSGS